MGLGVGIGIVGHPGPLGGFCQILLAFLKLARFEIIDFELVLDDLGRV